MVGFLIGLNSIILKKLLMDNVTDEVNTMLTYFVVFLYSGIFLYFYISESSVVGGDSINPLIILISIISIIGGLLLTKQNSSTTNNVTRNVRVNMNMGILAWIGAILLVHSSGTNYIGTIVQSILIGCFVAYFSYYGPKYIFETDDTPATLPMLTSINKISRRYRLDNLQTSN